MPPFCVYTSGGVLASWIVVEFDLRGGWGGEKRRGTVGGAANRTPRKIEAPC